jgi:hypothetical protein
MSYSINLQHGVPEFIRPDSEKCLKAKALELSDRLHRRDVSTKAEWKEADWLTDDQALLLLTYGDANARALVQDEITNERYIPNADVGAALTHIQREEEAGEYKAAA